MKAIILMAGKGTRWAKYYKGPKQLMPVAGKPIIEHILEMLPKVIDSLVFVVGGPHEQTLREYFKSGEHQGRPITFVVQTEQLGLAHAYKFAKEVVGNERWMGLVGDDIVGPKGLEELTKHELAVLAYPSPHPENFGVFVTDEDDYLVRSVEKPKEFISDLVSTGHIMMDRRFMDAHVPPSARGEYETPDALMHLINEEGAKIKVVRSEFWLPINDKLQFEEAVQVLENLKHEG